MAKRKTKAEKEADTKNLKQVLKARTKRKEAGIKANEEEEEEKLRRKVQQKPRVSTKQQPAAVTTSKYFESAMKEGEGDSDGFMTSVSSVVTAKNKDDEEEEDNSDEDEDDWEEVEELAEPLGPAKPPELVLPSEPVEIEIETPEIRKRKKRQAEFETYLRRMMNRYKKDVRIDTHKVHLLCLIASGMFHNRLCCEPDLLAITLSLLPAHFGTVAKQRMDQNYLSGLLKWFRATFTLNPSLPSVERQDLRALLERRLASLSARDHKEMTYLFMLVLRSLQLFCRLILSLQPVPLKPPSAKGKVGGAPGKTHSSLGTSDTSPPKPKVSPGAKRPAGGRKSGGERGGKKAKKKESKEQEEEKVVTPGAPRPKNSKRRSIASKVSYKEESDSDGAERLSDEEFQVSSDEDSDDSDRGASCPKGAKGRGRSRASNTSTTAQKRRTGGEEEQVKEEEEECEDGESKEEDVSTRRKRRSGKKDEGPGADEWLEVFLEKPSSWVCVDVEHGVGMPHLCSRNATAPLTYVVSVDEDGFLKDLGRKYDPTWMTSSRKRRVEEDWWEETLEPFQRREDEREKKEDKEMQNKLLNKPLPVSIAEYKNHPLYALKRHLLKYEAVYPSTATVLGYCRGEAVYSRDCVHTLHSRDTWLKEARTVRIGEEPYKMVKGFSNRSRKARMASEQKEENDLALFGEWQTEEYQPPLAVDGKVPRNDYGNVYLFKPCMLPVGCVHLRLANLNRVARKLELDAAPAVTGFDFHGGYSHAVTDGYIVCEEHEEILRAAWVEEQELQKQKEKEKREKRVISNWTLLVKGLLIKERLKLRYGYKDSRSCETDGDKMCELSSDEERTEDGSMGAKTANETLAMSWPQNRQAEEERGGVSGVKKTKRERRGQEKHLFPFEKV